MRAERIVALCIGNRNRCASSLNRSACMCRAVIAKSPESPESRAASLLLCEFQGKFPVLLNGSNHHVRMTDCSDVLFILNYTSCRPACCLEDSFKHDSVHRHLRADWHQFNGLRADDAGAGFGFSGGGGLRKKKTFRCLPPYDHL